MTPAHPHDTIEERRLVRAAAEVVWAALVEDRHRRRWWHYLDLVAVPGGEVREAWTDESGREKLASGRVPDVVVPSLLRMTWSDDNRVCATTVEIRMARSAGGAEVSVRHVGWRDTGLDSSVVDAHRAGGGPTSATSNGRAPAGGRASGVTVQLRGGGRCS